MDQSIIDSFATTPAATREQSSSMPPSADATPEAGSQTSYMGGEVHLALPRRPGERLLARAFDLLFFFVLVEAAIVFWGPGQLSVPVLLAGVVPCILLYLLADALLMAVFGTTPGKRLLRVTVIPETRRRLTLRQAVQRSFAVGWHGLALGAPGVCLVTLCRARNRLLEKGSTQWDEAGRLYVVHEGASLIGSLALFGFSALLLLAGAILGGLFRDHAPASLIDPHAVELEQQDNVAADVLPAALPAPTRAAAENAQAAARPPGAAQPKAMASGRSGHKRLASLPHVDLGRSSPGGWTQETSAIASTVWGHLNAPAAAPVQRRHRHHAAVPPVKHGQGPTAVPHTARAAAATRRLAGPPAMPARGAAVNGSRREADAQMGPPTGEGEIPQAQARRRQVAAAPIAPAALSAAIPGRSADRSGTSPGRSADLSGSSPGRSASLGAVTQHAMAATSDDEAPRPAGYGSVKGSAVTPEATAQAGDGGWQPLTDAEAIGETGDETEAMAAGGPVAPSTGQAAAMTQTAADTGVAAASGSALAPGAERALAPVRPAETDTPPDAVIPITGSMPPAAAEATPPASAVGSGAEVLDAPVSVTPQPR